MKSFTSTTLSLSGPLHTPQNQLLTEIFDFLRNNPQYVVAPDEQEYEI